VRGGEKAAGLDLCQNIEVEAEGFRDQFWKWFAHDIVSAQRYPFGEIF
jgi:hypothetical protein